MSRYETRYLTWQYFSLSGTRLTTGTWAFRSFCVSRSPVFSILLACSGEPGSHLGTGCSKHWFEHYSSNPLLNHHFFLAGIYPPFQILRRDRDHVFPVRQGRREIVERAIVTDDWHFPAVHHDARSRLGLARHFDHVSVLHKRIDVERHLCFFLRLHNDRKAILFAFHRYLARRIVRLDGPIIGPDGQTGHNHALRLHL